MIAASAVFTAGTACAKSQIKTIVTEFPVSGTPVKLPGGKVLIYGKTNFDGKKAQPNITFDSYTNTFKITKFFNNSINPSSEGNSAVLLNNGKVLFAAPRMFYPSYDTVYQIDKALVPKLNKEEKKKLKETLEGKSQNEKEAILLPTVKKYPELYEKYLSDIKYYNNSIYAQLYDPRTEKFEATGKLNIRRENHTMVKAKNGKVYIFGGQAENNRDLFLDLTRAQRAKAVEEYDPKSGVFKIVGGAKFETKYSTGKQYFKVFPLQDGRIFLAWSNEGKIQYTFFNPEDYSFEEYRTYDNTFLDMVKLKDERILFFTKSSRETPPADLKYWSDKKSIQNLGKKLTSKLYLDIVIYNPKEDKFEEGGNITVPRHYLSSPLVLALNDGRMLIAGGATIVSTNLIFPIYSIEIYDPNTKKSTVIGSLPVELLPCPNGVVLNDDRVLIYGNAYAKERSLKTVIITP